jgi:hypothetical protein
MLLPRTLDEWQALLDDRLCDIPAAPFVYDYVTAMIFHLHTEFPLVKLIPVDLASHVDHPHR